MRPGPWFVKGVNTIYCASFLGRSQDVDACGNLGPLVLRARVLRAGVLRATVLRATVLRATVLRATVLRARVLRATVLRAGVLRATVLRASSARAVWRWVTQRRCGGIKRQRITQRMDGLVELTRNFRMILR